ncbi:glycoside hydrolase family 2 protein [Paenibacillus glycanilyticus]|uniref:beta-mannosidase n=1 Tax=Paenibacillus glycanilyticus TaxID=126569 RepID=UPI00203E3A58|nr:glycoside hydrolase family 2 protein [Paenibacillus glycanilyticus]MCM3631268.1 glycoside hydrolase family 2 protein [Paenibacillus glycanilyticus]
MSELKWQISDWTFKNSEEQEWRPAFVPGCVHTDLLKNGLIPDPFVGTNEKDLQWIDKKVWEYESVFDASSELLGHSRLELVFEGLDTYADVYLNESLILSANNMFRTWTVDAKPHVREKDNRLYIRFRSPVEEGLSKLEAYGTGLPAPNDDSVIGGLEGKKVSVFSRKAPYHYGWDWGPRLATSGIGKPVYLRGWSGARISDLYIQQDEVTAAAAVLTVQLSVDSESSGEFELKLRTNDGQEWTRSVALEQGTQTVAWPITVEQPKLWWSRGLGEPHMYAFTASLLQGTADVAQAAVKTGLRSIKLIRKPDEHGSSFFFEVNGIPVFAKGANHIPSDSFFSEVTPERYRHEIASAVESNFNMLRVWGGGIYEQDIFYELCDENGMLVWQDFMFACSMYPGDEAFLNSVRAEAEDNVRRLRNHPSIALWCGNNEMDTAWSHYAENSGWGWKQLYTAERREQIWADYEAVFHQVLPEVVAAMAPEIEYWPSSPMQRLTANSEQHATNNSSHGDIHYWAVWHAQEPFERYNQNIGRFMSEYGFQSFPEYKTVRAYAEEKDMALDSEVMLHHQKNGRGNFLIKDYADRYMKQPKDFPSFLYISQVLQAEAMKQAIEAHRRSMDYCMGSLYWQINDCWPVASWASMDYFGRWKAAQYLIKNSFKDLLLSFDQKDEVTNLHVVSDLGQSIDAVLEWSLHELDGRLLKSGTETVAIGARSAKLVLSLSAEQLGSFNPNNAVLVGRLVQAGGELARSEHYFVYTKDLELADPGIAVEEIAGSGGSAFVLTAKQLAKQVWVQAEEEGIFTDNFFDLVPGIPVTVQFKKKAADSVEFVAAAPGRLTVQSMFNYAK